MYIYNDVYIDGLVQDYSNSIAKHWSYCSLELSHWIIAWNTTIIEWHIDMPVENHYNDVIMSAMAFTPLFIQAQIKENIKAPRHWPLWREVTGDRWIPHTKGQQRGKYFHLVTSSFCNHMLYQALKLHLLGMKL